MRRRRSSAGDELTLFPFLAVLICTVGSLIVLLVVMMQQAKAKVADRSPTERPETQSLAATEQIQLKVDELNWRIEVLQQSREKTVADLKTREVELSYIEDEIRQLRARLDRAAAEAAHIKELAAQESDDRQATATQVARLREQLEQSLQALELARRAFNDQERSYALVPYNGASGTRRRPIYIECTANRVILQPEGVELYSDDFREPLTDDNALASALRAQREYFADATLDREEPPYPLIIIRPDGAHAYAAARAAMEAWDAEFGYELVDDVMKLAFPPVDAALVEVVREAVEEARARRRLLQSIAPARFGRKPPVLTASRSGGFVAQGSRDGAAGTGDEQLPDARTAERSAATGGPADRQSARTGPANGERGGGGSGGAAAGQGGSERVADGSPPTGFGSPDEFTASDATGSGPAHERSGRSSAGRGGAGGDLPPESGGLRPGEYHPSEAGRQRPPRSTASPDSGTAAARGGAQQAAAAAGRRQHGGSNAPQATGGTAAGNAALSGGARGSSSASGDLDLSPSATDAARGGDWGLPERAEGATAITRPIHVSCYSDHLVIFPESGQRTRPSVVPIKGTLREEVDQLVSKIWERIDSWGIAGSRMYWRPVLEVQVQKGAEARFAELVQSLEGSGIELKRR